MDEKILEVKNLEVVLDGEKIIYDLSFTVKKGDVVTILGPNGAGKTVLLKTLLGIFPYKGEIIWKENIKIGYVPQRLPFVKDIPMSVGEFFELKKIKEKDVIEILKYIGFSDDFLKRNIGKISSGQYQKILIAWALVGNPDVLLFDEPTAGIDIAGEETIYRLLSKLNKENGLTIILVSHELSVVYNFSNYVICLNKHPLCQGEPKQILTPKHLAELYGEEVKFYVHDHGK